jgi:predicted RNA-binding protein with RPS1 domain
MISADNGEDKISMPTAALSNAHNNNRGEKSTQMPMIGTTYKACEIKSIQDYGVFVEVFPGYEALVHVSELSINYLDHPSRGGYIVGQRLDLQCVGQNDRGQYRFSRRSLLLREASSSETSAGSLFSSTPMRRMPPSQWQQLPPQPQQPQAQEWRSQQQQYPSNFNQRLQPQQQQYQQHQREFQQYRYQPNPQQPATTYPTPKRSNGNLLQTNTPQQVPQ